MVDHNADATLAVTVSAYSSYAEWREIPDNKFAYELDGTTVRYFRAGNGGAGEAGVTEWTEYLMSDAEVRALNGWSARYPHDSAYESYMYHFIFPEPRNIEYICLTSGLGGGVGGNQYWRMYYSTDTTNGSDGTWTSIGVTTHQWYGATYGHYRKWFWDDHVALTNIRGIKLNIDHTLALMGNGGGRPHLVHIFGNKSEDANRLAFWHPTLDKEIEKDWFDWYHFDYGEETRDFRIKNLSPTKRVLNTVVSFDTTGDPWSPAISANHMIWDGSNWADKATIPMLASKEISQVYSIKRNFQPQYRSIWFNMRIKAVAGSWVTYIHNVPVTLSAYTTMDNAYRRDQNAAASLAAIAEVSDGTLYRNSSAYRSDTSYRGSKTIQTHAASASLTASTASTDMYVDSFTDEYAPAGMFAVAHNLNQKTTSALTAGPNGDNYADEYADAYGNAGLYAVATVT